MAKCPACGESKAVENQTWQQWQCACCGSWNDRPEATRPVAEPKAIDDQTQLETMYRGLLAVIRHAPAEKPDMESYDDMDSAYGSGLNDSAWEAAEIAREAIKAAGWQDQLERDLARKESSNG